MLAAAQGDDIRLYVVWFNVLRADDRYTGYLRSTEFDDPRLSYYWDEYKLSGVEWQEALDIKGLAWDVYLLYDRDSRWQTLPTDPDYWMNQIGIADSISPRLDSKRLQARVSEMMEGGK